MRQACRPPEPIASGQYPDRPRTLISAATRSSSASATLISAGVQTTRRHRPARAAIARTDPSEPERVVGLDSTGPT